MLQLGGTISHEGKLSVYDQRKLDAWRVKHAGKDIVLSIKEKRPTRSAPQNAYYWGVLVAMVMDGINSFGNDFDETETHEFLKGKFNAKQIEVTEGHYLDVAQSTSKMNTKEFMSYLESIQQFASITLGIYIPSPNEQTTIDFYINQENGNN